MSHTDKKAKNDSDEFEPIHDSSTLSKLPTSEAINNRAYEIAGSKGRNGHPLKIDFEKAERELRSAHEH